MKQKEKQQEVDERAKQKRVARNCFRIEILKYLL
jgi:hypothetical protein